MDCGSPYLAFCAECTKIAHRRSLAIFTADEGIGGNSAARANFTHFFAEEILAILSQRKSRILGPHKITLHALQKTFVDFLFKFAWEFCIEKWQGFLVNFFWSPFPTKQSTKIPEKSRGKFGAKFGAKFGTKIRKIRGIFVLRLF